MNQQALTQTILGLGALLVIAVALVLLFFKTIPMDNAQPLDVILGYVAGFGSAAYSFYFGSTKSSQTKDDTIQSLTKSVGTGDGKQP